MEPKAKAAATGIHCSINSTGPLSLYESISSADSLHVVFVWDDISGNQLHALMKWRPIRCRWNNTVRKGMDTSSQPCISVTKHVIYLFPSYSGLIQTKKCVPYARPK
jgi:hypothetical protein